MSREVYFDLYNEMATNQVAGWNYDAYGSPQFFLYLLRRHVVTGAFCHPKYGGNVGAAGWPTSQKGIPCRRRVQGSRARRYSNGSGP